MLAILQNNFRRIWQQKMYLLVSFAMTAFSILLAVLITGKLEPKLQIAVVGEVPEIVASDTVNVTQLDEKPAESQLVEGRYDAVVYQNDAGGYEVTCLKSQTVKEQIEAAVQTEAQTKVQTEAQMKEQTEAQTNEQMEAQSGQDSQAEVVGTDSNGRKIGTNIVGFMMMFLLMQGNLYAKMFAEDKEKHQIERIVCAPIRFRQYIAGHAVFIWLMITIPAMAILTVLELFGVELGFGLIEYAGILALFDLFATALSLCVNSFFKVSDDANMVGSAIVVLTTILSGSFYDRSSESSLMSKLLQLLPQKDIMLFLTNFENHILNRSNMIGLMYVILFILVLLIIGIKKTKNDYIYNRG